MISPEEVDGPEGFRGGADIRVVVSGVDFIVRSDGERRLFSNVNRLAAWACRELLLRDGIFP
jgi:hypothetical protein